MEAKQIPTADELVDNVRSGIEAIVRDALAEADRLHEEADEHLAHYDNLVNEATRLRSEIFGLRKDIADIPARLQTARLDALVYGGGEDPDSLKARYIQARERLPVAEQRLGRLEDELSIIVSGGSRPSKVDPSGGQRRLVKHEARIPILDGLNDVAEDLERLREALPDVVTKATEDLLKQRDNLRNDQNMLWGQSKA
jgi:chromosome segregation ATPase